MYMNNLLIPLKNNATLFNNWELHKEKIPAIVATLYMHMEIMLSRGEGWAASTGLTPPNVYACP